MDFFLFFLLFLVVVEYTCFKIFQRDKNENHNTFNVISFTCIHVHTIKGSHPYNINCSLIPLNMENLMVFCHCIDLYQIIIIYVKISKIISIARHSTDHYFIKLLYHINFYIPQCHHVSLAALTCLFIVETDENIHTHNGTCRFTI